jgi:hypothetical protein
VALGTLTGTVRNGNQVTPVTQDVAIPVESLQIEPNQAGVCQVLRLVMGPLHLELLGLIVDLNQVVLVITADPAGGILGSLLCSLADALGLGSTLDTIVGLLQKILAAL